MQAPAQTLQAQLPRKFEKMLQIQHSPALRRKLVRGDSHIAAAAGLAQLTFETALNFAFRTPFEIVEVERTREDYRIRTLVAAQLLVPHHRKPELADQTGLLRC